MARIRMKRQSNIGIRKKVIAYCLAGIMSVSLLAVPSVKADAAASKKFMNLVNTTNPTGSVTGGGVDHIYFGTYSQTTNNFDGRFRVLDASKTNTGAKGMFLLSENALGEANGTGAGDIIFRPTGSKAYSGSNVQSWCTSFYNSTFSSIEKNAILATTKGDASYEGRSGVKSETAEGILNGDKVFLPSYEEVYNSSYGFGSDAARKISFMKADGVEYPVNWWTRSPYTANNNCLMVNTSGKVIYKSVNNGLCVRPAFNLNTSNVIFTSAATGGKSSDSAGSNALTAVNSYSGTDWKLTVKDSNRSNFNASFVSVNNDVVTVNYSGASYGSNEYVSAIIVNSSGDIKYYGRIKQISSSGSASGQITINTSGKLANTDKLYVFSEQCNGDKKTDYSSLLKEISYAPANVVIESPIPSLSKGNNSVVVSWQGVKGVEKYRVFRKKTGGTWGILGDTNSTSYTDLTGESGDTYYYAVRCISSDGSEYLSEYDETKTASIVYPVLNLQSPLPVVSVQSENLRINWNGVERSPKYRVYRKTESGSWKELADVNTNSYLDETGVGGTTYYYAVRCLSADGETLFSSLDNNKIAEGTYPIVTLKSPLPVLQTVSNGVSISWDKEARSPKYRLYRRIEGGSWKVLANVSANSYIDTTGVDGKKYDYAIRCLDSDNSTLLSPLDKNKIASITYPVLKPESPYPTLSTTSNGVLVSWTRVTDVPKYRVFRKVSDGGSWKKLADVSGNSYEDTSGSGGTKYEYAIRCLAADGTTLLSNLDKQKISSIVFPVVKLSSPKPVLTDSEGVVFIIWDEVTNSPKYKLYRRKEGGSWKNLAEVSSNTYTDTTGVGGQKYEYAIRCLDNSGKLLSDLDKNKISSITYPIKEIISPIPVLKSVSDGVEISWEKETSSPQYRIYRKVEGGSWKAIADVGTNSYTDASGSFGKKYTYAIRCLDSDGTTLLSKFDSGRTAEIVYPTKVLMSPQPLLVEAPEGFEICWEPVAGAEKYRIFRKTAEGSWKAIADTSNTSYIDSNLVHGNIYYYAIRCLSADGTLISKFNNQAVSSLPY